MKKTLLAVVTASFLAACVEVPDEGNSAPSVQLQAVATQTYPGSSFRVNQVLSDDNTKTSDLNVNWSFSDSGITIVEQTTDYTVFSVGLAVDTNQEAVITATVIDSEGDTTEQSIAIDIITEPFVIVDAETDEIQTPNSQPIYLTGVYSAKRINLKQFDSMASENYIIDVSPDGRFVFYTQLFVNAVWQAKLYDSQTDINHTVIIDFKDIDHNSVGSYWSSDSQYLAIEMPHESDAAQNSLYWLDTSTIGEGDIEPHMQTFDFDSLTWSDNQSGEQAYASLATATTISVLDPTKTGEDETPITQLTASNDVAFTQVTVGSEQWATNQLFFIASTTVVDGSTVTEYETNLYNYLSGQGYVEKINGSAGSKNISRFQAYVATQVVYQDSDSNQLYFYNGVEETAVTLNGIDQLVEAQTEFDWSPDGSLLGVRSNPDNTGSANGSYTVSVWKDNDSTKLPFSSTTDTAVDGYTGYNISGWHWTTNRDRIAILSEGTSTNTLLVGATDEDDAMITVVEDIAHDDSAGSVGDELMTYLLRSPTGQWQLFWGMDEANDSKHVDLWAYNVDSGAVINVSALGAGYLVPQATGQFSLADTGYASDDEDELYYVSESLAWVNDSTVIFEVRDLTDSDIQDIRVMDLSASDAAHSIVLQPDDISTIESLVSN